MELKNNMTNINKIIEEFIKRFVIEHEGGWVGIGEVTEPYQEMEKDINPQDIEDLIIKALKNQEAKHQKITDFLIESHAFDMKELKKKHQKKLKEINEFGGDETDAYNLIDKLNEEK